MKDRKRHSIGEIRRLVRRNLIAEANRPETGTGPWQAFAKDMSSSRSIKTKGSEYNRFRGLVDGSTRAAESPQATMTRFLDDLNAAEPGDVFYLTYGIGELEVEEGTDFLINDTGAPLVRNSTKTLDLIKATLHGAYETSEDEENARDEETITRREVLKKASSPFAVGQRMVSEGMREINTSQRERLAELKASLRDIKSGAITREKAVDQLASIIRLGDALIEQLKSNEIDTRKKGVTAVLDALHAGKANLTANELRRENRLIQSAQIMAFGTGLIKQTISETGIPGTGVETREPSSEESRVYGRNASVGTRRIVSEVGYGSGEKIHNFIPMLGQMSKSVADDILLGGCISDQRFANLKRVIPSHVFIARMESSGLPLTVLMTRVELLLNTIRYDNFKGGDGYLTNHAAGKFAATHPVSSLMWSTHLHPSQTISLAEGFLNNSSYLSSGELNRGSRVDNHENDRVDRIMRTIRDAKGKIKTGELKAAEGAADTPRPEDVVSMFNGEVPAAEATSIEEVAAVMKAQGDILRTKESRLKLDSPLKEKEYNDERKGNSSLATALLAREIAMHQAESFIYENILRRLLFGVTLRCVGKRIGVDIRGNAIRVAIESGKTAERSRSHTSREFPIFEAMIERPKQSSISVIQDPDQLRSMVDKTFSIASGKKQSHASALEGGSAIDAPGEALKKGRGSKYHKSEVVTPNLHASFNAEQIREALKNGEDVLSMVSDAGSYEAGKPFHIPYIEKITTYEQNVSPDRVMQLESMYDNRLRPLRVTVQLLGAKKFSDKRNANRQVAFSYLTPIPEMGITPAEYKPISETTGTAADLAGIAERNARRANSTQGISEQYDLTSYKSYDLTDRIKQDINVTHPLRKEAVKAAEMLRRDIEEGGVNNATQHKSRIYKGIVRDLQMSHSMDASALETLVNSRAVQIALEGLTSEANRIVGTDVGSISNDVLEVKNLAGSGSAIEAIGRLVRAPKWDVSPYDLMRANAVFKAISDGLLREAGTESEKITLSDIRPVAAMSVIVRAAFGTMRDPSLSTSVNRIRNRLMRRRSAAGDIVYSAGSGAGGTVSAYPSVLPLLPSLTSSKNAAEKLLQDINRLNIQDAARTINGTLTHAEIDADLEHASDNMIPAEVLETATSVRTLIGIVKSHLSGDGKEMQITRHIRQMYENLAKFSEELDASGFGRRARDAGRTPAAVSIDNPLFERSFRRPETILGEFLLVADTVLMDGMSPRKDIDDLVESAVTRMSRQSVSKASISDFGQTAIAVAILKAVAERRTRTSPVYAPGADVHLDVYDVRSYLDTQLADSASARGGDRAILKIKKALSDAAGEISKKSGDSTRTSFDVSSDIMSMADPDPENKQKKKSSLTIQLEMALESLLSEYVALEKAVTRTSVTASFVKEQEDREDGSKTVAELLTDFSDNVLPHLRAIRPLEVKAVSQTVSNLIINSSSLVESLDRILDETLRMETGRGGQPGVTQAKKLKESLEEIDRILDEIDDRALSMENVVNSPKSSILGQILDVERIASFNPTDIVVSALEIAETLTSSGSDATPEAAGRKKGVAIWVIENITQTFGMGDRARAYTNIAMNVGYNTANPQLISNELEAARKNVGLTPDQVALIDAIITSDGGVSRLHEFIDPYEVAKKILLYDATHGNKTISIAAGLRQAFFPGSTKSAITRADPTEVQRLKPRNTSLALRSKDIIQSQAAARRVASDFVSGGKRGEDALRAILALGDYFAATSAVGGFGRVMTSPASEAVPTRAVSVSRSGALIEPDPREFMGQRPEVPGRVRFPNGPEGNRQFAAAMEKYKQDLAAFNAANEPEVTRVRPMSTAAAQRNAMFQAAKRGATREPGVMRPGGPSLGTSDVDLTEYSTVGDNIERFLAANRDLEVNGHPVADISLDEAIDAVKSGDLDASLSGVLDVASHALQDLMVRSAMNSVSRDPVARDRARSEALKTVLEDANSTMLGSVNSEIRRLMRGILGRKGAQAASPTPTSPAPASTAAPTPEEVPTPSAGRTLTPEAEDLIAQVDSGAIPTMGINRNMVDIALANGVGEDQIDNLRAMDNTTLAVKALVRLLKLKRGR